MAENRRFTRIVFSAPVTLTADEKRWNTELIDVSLKGVLVVKPKVWHCQPGDQFILSFQLAGSDIDITMAVHKAHERENCIGFTCDSIDLDSASYLRRMIELNVGSAEMLNRDLEHLTIPEDA
ncbi:MAG: PilZ domain-containing protein [Psychrosphaera sp.]|nr:PilZ domain-containing protein [Psychrosphaera sp.]